MTTSESRLLTRADVLRIVADYLPDFQARAARKDADREAARSAGGERGHCRAWPDGQCRYPDCDCLLRPASTHPGAETAAGLTEPDDGRLYLCGVCRTQEECRRSNKCLRLSAPVPTLQDASHVPPLVPIHTAPPAFPSPSQERRAGELRARQERAREFFRSRFSDMWNEDDVNELAALLNTRLQSTGGTK